MDPLLVLDSITKIFPDRNRGVVRALDGVSLSVAAGEDLAIVGESGCGKTTLARIIMGLIRADSGTVRFEGSLVWGRRDRERHFRRKVRMVFQDPFASLDPRFPVRAILEEALCLEAPSSAAACEARMREVLSAVRLPTDILKRHPHEFSGGERQRISLARALMTSPALLILDEAVSSLDVIVRREVLQVLEDLRKEQGLTYFLITHDLKVARQIGKKIAVMRAGRVVEYGSAADIWETPRHAYTRELISSV